MDKENFVKAFTAFAEDDFETSKEISTEIDLEIIDKINTVATAKTLDFASVAGDNKSDKYNSFVAYVLNLANVIGKETNHGNGNFVIASSNISGVIESTPPIFCINDRR